MLGVVAITILSSHNFLQNHGHFFLVYDVARGLHIGFGVFEKDRGINAFDGIAEHMEHAVAIVEKGHHVGVVMPAKVDSGCLRATNWIGRQWDYWWLR